MNLNPDIAEMRDLARRLALTLGVARPHNDGLTKFNRHVLSLLGEAVDKLGITQEEADEYEEEMQAGQ